MLRIDGRQVTLHVHDHIDLVARIECLQRLVDAVGARLVMAGGHDDLVPGCSCRCENLLRISGDSDATDARCPRAIRDVDDHGATANVGKRLSRQAGCGHTSRDKYEIGHGQAGPRIRDSGKKSQLEWSLYVLQRLRKRPSFRAISPASTARGIWRAHEGCAVANVSVGQGSLWQKYGLV
jgi:hypothetical protein